MVGPGFLETSTRGVERTFSLGIFQKRCKPPASGAAGNGRALRDTAGECLGQVLKHVTTSRELLRFPHVIPNASVVEASPAVFLSVMIGDDVFSKRPSLSRGEKFSWLLEKCVEGKRLVALRERLDWPDDDLWTAFDTCRERDQVAALICALTAVCVVQKCYVAIGGLRGGYFFLPPWGMWADWAKQGIAENRQRPELGGKLDIWINAYPRDLRTKLPA